MAITPTAASGTTSGIDVPTLVSQLMAVANRPVDKLNAHISTAQMKLSDFGTISGLVSSLQTATLGLNTSLQKNSAASSDLSILTASASSIAAIGNYTINVSNLAQAQNLVSTGQTSSTAAIGNGTATTLSFNFGTTAGTVFTSNGAATSNITINNTNNTLQGISSAINAANIGVTATIVNDGSAIAPFRIAITSNTTGTTSSMKITTTGGDGTVGAILGYDPAGVKSMSQTVAAQNASFTVNGIAISSASNTVSTAIQGVTMNLKSITTAPATLTIARDTTSITSAVNAMVDAYNGLHNQLKSRSAYGTATSAGSSLAGNGTLRTMLSQLQSLFSSPATPATGGNFTYLTQIGVSLQSNGTLQVDSTKLNNALATSFSDVSNVVSSATGFATRLKTWTDNVLSPGNGLIPIATDSINTAITNDNNQITQLQSRLKMLQSQYTQQYTSLNMLLSNMSGTSAYLSQQLR